jgi:DNA repair protein RadA/Sms
MSNEHKRTLYICSECNAEALRWEGKCPVCGQWNTLEERSALPGNHYATKSWITEKARPVQELSEIDISHETRLDLGSQEINRVMGGGVVNGSFVLLGGDPGIGKSTLLLQIANSVSKSRKPVLYVSGEESPQQLKMRADRIGIKGIGLEVVSETNMNRILNHIDTIDPSITIIDSIQSVAFPDIPSGPGNISQVRESGLALLHKAKETGSPIIITGHVTKDGSIAGPRTLEHMVDVVLYLEGDNLGSYRLLRGEKNRFGSTNEIGVFEMGENGLLDIPNPSHVSLSDRGASTVGSAIVPIIEGTRPILVEIQALTTPSSLPTPRRVANGIDASRLSMVIAVLTKRIGVSISKQDIILNVAGGFRATEPAADLGIALALMSSLKNISIPLKIAAVGEIGLGGELRGVSQMSRRLAELGQMGFEGCLAPISKVQTIDTNIVLFQNDSLSTALAKVLHSARK